MKNIAQGFLILEYHDPKLAVDIAFETYGISCPESLF